MTRPKARAQCPTVISTPGQECMGTAGAQSGHTMGTKQKATRLGGFRFAANLWKTPTSSRAFRHQLAALDQIMEARLMIFLHRLSAFADFHYGMAGLAGND